MATSPTPPTPPNPTTKPSERSGPVTAGLGDPDCAICHGLGYVRQDLPLGHADFGKVQPCSCQLATMQFRHAAQLREDSNTETLTGKTFDNFLPDGVSPDPLIRATLRSAFERCKAFAETPENWLLLTGSYGCGKTHLAAAIANLCLTEGRPVLFLNVPDLLDYLRATFSPSVGETYAQRFDEIRTAPLLILDDLGTESPTAWAAEKLYQLINYRYNAHLPTVITTNKHLEDIEPRVASRLSDAEIVTRLNVLAPDFRGKIDRKTELSTLELHRNQTFDNFDTRSELAGEARQMLLNATRAAREFADEPRGWIAFLGPYASGKTHLAAAIANHRAQAGKAVAFVTYHDLSDLFRSAGREADERNAKLIQQAKTSELLVLDDLPGAGGMTGFVRDRFFQVFNYRFDARLPTVLTTSADDKELDPRVKSRLYYADVSQVHVLKVEPYRGKKRASRRK